MLHFVNSMFKCIMCSAYEEGCRVSVAACLDCRVHRLPRVLIFRQRCILLFRLQGGHCLFRSDSRVSIDVQTVQCLLHVQTADCSLLVQPAGCWDVQTSECRVFTAWSDFKSGHSSDYSNVLTVQDVRMAHCFKTVQSLSGLLRLFCLFRLFRVFSLFREFKLFTY